MRALKRNSKSVCNLWLIIISAPLSCLIILRSLEKQPFCSDDVEFRPGGCIRCPSHATCRNGRLTCWPTYKVSGKKCVKDEEIERKNHEKAAKCARIIAHFNVSSDYLSSRISEERLLEIAPECGDPEIQKLLGEYDIIHDTKTGQYVSKDPILGISGRIVTYFRANIPTVIFTGIVLFFVLIALIIGVRKRHAKTMVNSYVQHIVSALQEDRSRDFKYASNFEVVETNPLNRYWPQIVSAVERNPNVVVLNSSRGRMWRSAD